MYSQQLLACSFNPSVVPFRLLVGVDSSRRTHPLKVRFSVLQCHVGFLMTILSLPVACTLHVTRCSASAQSNACCLSALFLIFIFAFVELRVLAKYRNNIPMCTEKRIYEKFRLSRSPAGIFLCAPLANNVGRPPMPMVRDHHLNQNIE